MFERCCDDRETAERNGEFVYLRDYDGWCFVDGPRRRMTFKASYLLNERGGMQHIGEFYSFLDCPWCGAELPKPEDPEQWSPTQADGEDGG
jgi:hypothetical protein